MEKAASTSQPKAMRKQTGLTAALRCKAQSQGRSKGDGCGRTAPVTQASSTGPVVELEQGSSSQGMRNSLGSSSPQSSGVKFPLYKFCNLYNSFSNREGPSSLQLEHFNH